MVCIAYSALVYSGMVYIGMKDYDSALRYFRLVSNATSQPCHSLSPIMQSLTGSVCLLALGLMLSTLSHLPFRLPNP